MPDDTKYDGAALDPDVAAALDIINKLELETKDDGNVNYKKLYYAAFNGLTSILKNMGYPEIKNTFTAVIVKLQQDLEDMYVSQ